MGVGVEVAAPLGAEPLQGLEVLRGMHARERVERCWLGHDLGDRLVEVRAGNPGEHGIESGGALRMSGSRVVSRKRRVKLNDNAHAHEGTGPNLFFVRPGPGDVLRVASWRGDPKIALLTSLPGRPAPGRVELERVLDAIADSGYEVVLTGALDVTAQRPYVAAGFEEHARLHVLGRALDELPTAEHAQLHRARRRDRGEVHEVDASAFSPFWQLGEAGLDDALGATPVARFRVARDNGVVGYAICGQNPAIVQRSADFFDKTDKGRVGKTPTPL